ncbi:hypothetical protein GS507_24505 [Rhodococcus hoagii]|nr:hypothetical protein [Prescottella equi]
MAVTNSPMRKVSLRNLAAHKVRLVLTVLSVVLGTAFVAGSFVFTDTLQKTFDSIFDGTAQGVDVRVSAVEQGSSGVPIADVDVLRNIDGVRAVAPSVGGQVVVLDSAESRCRTAVPRASGRRTSPRSRRSASRRSSLRHAARAGRSDRAQRERRYPRRSRRRSATRVLTMRGWSDVTVAGIYAPEGSRNRP